MIFSAESVVRTIQWLRAPVFILLHFQELILTGFMGCGPACAFVYRYELTSGWNYSDWSRGGNAGLLCQNRHHACGRSLSLLCRIFASKALCRAVNHNTLQPPCRLAPFGSLPLIEIPFSFYYDCALFSSSLHSFYWK